MANKTGFKPTTVIFTLVVALGAGIFLFRNPAVNGTRTDEETVTLVVEFDPQERDKYIGSVYIKVSVGGKKLMDDMATSSQWVRRVNVARGVRIELDASQDVGKTLDCFINHNDVPVHTDHRSGPGEVMCHHTFAIGLGR